MDSNLNPENSVNEIPYLILLTSKFITSYLDVRSSTNLFHSCHELFHNRFALMREFVAGDPLEYYVGIMISSFKTCNDNGDLTPFHSRRILKDFTFPPSTNIKTLYFHKNTTVILYPLPKSLTHIHFAEYFRAIEKIDFTQVPNLTHITFGNSFNDSVDNLPFSLLYLKLGNSFRKEVDHLPPNLHTLILGQTFNQPLDHLPSTLKHLELGTAFNHPVDKLPNLEYLRFGIGFQCDLHHLPLTLTHLVLSSFYRGSLVHGSKDLNVCILPTQTT